MLPGRGLPAASVYVAVCRALDGRSADFVAVLDSGSGSHRTGKRIGCRCPCPCTLAHRNFYPARGRLRKLLQSRPASPQLILTDADRNQSFIYCQLSSGFANKANLQSDSFTSAVVVVKFESSSAFALTSYHLPPSFSSMLCSEDRLHTFAFMQILSS